MESINFYSGKTAYRSLSNFWERPVKIENREYETGEHSFHGEKYYRLSQLCTDEKRADILKEYSKHFISPSRFVSPSIAKQKGGKKGLLLNMIELNCWAIVSIEVQREICKYKFEQYEEVRKDLFQSKQNILVHPALRKLDEYVMKHSFWEGRYKPDGCLIGQNKLGTIWMDLRSKLIVRDDE
jgi:predicted NAD-dependent protein-ADP-ribosyltransferase YbiA (DUF1768 family)